MDDSLHIEQPKRAVDMISINSAAMNSTKTNSERYSSFSDKMKIYSVYGVMLIALFAFSVYKVSKDKVATSLITTCFVTSTFIVTFVICDIILRLCNVLILFTNTNQLSGKNNFTSILSHYLIPNTALMVIIVCAILLFLGQIITSRRYPLYYVWAFGPQVCASCMIFSFLLLRLATPEWQISKPSVFNINDMKGLDYGTGMAYSYYYGYLRLILPSTGTTTKGIIEKIENFEDKHNIHFPVHKLFILIPASGYIPPDLKEASNKWMESAQELEEERRNRAGVIGRTYHNNAYKIYPGGQRSGVDPIYIVVEGATPLLTFYEVQKHNHAESSIYRQFKHEIITAFHTTLYNILQSELETRDLCELIYYHDYEPDGTKVNIAKIILERISNIQRST